MNRLLSASVSTCSSSIGRSKLGQPVPESNLCSELNRGCPQATQTNWPGSLTSLSSLVNGASVPFLRTTSYCSGVSSSRHSCSLFLTFSKVPTSLPRGHDQVNPVEEQSRESAPRYSLPSAIRGSAAHSRVRREKLRG